MALLDIFRRKATSQSIAQALFGGSNTRSGAVVNSETAMRCSTVYACVSVLSESVAQLPCLLYRRTKDGGKERAVDHPLYSVLHDAPNSWQTAFEFWEMMVSHMATRGNAYAYIVRGMRDVKELIPLDPDQVQVTQNKDYSLTYKIKQNGVDKEISSDKILHFRYRTLDGVTGLSPIAYNRETIGLAISATAMGAELFASGATVAGVLTVQGALSPAATENLSKTWNDTYHSGDKRSFKTAVLDNGATWNKMALSAQDAQYLETRKFQRNEVAAIFRIPPHKIGDLENATFSNIEHQSIEFVTDALTPYCKRLEQAVKRDLINEPDIFCEFLLDALLRGDSVGRAALYRELFATGSINTNEIRNRENMNNIGAVGESRYVPSNLMPLGASGPVKQDLPGIKENA